MSASLSSMSFGGFLDHALWSLVLCWVTFSCACNEQWECCWERFSFTCCEDMLLWEAAAWQTSCLCRQHRLRQIRCHSEEGEYTAVPTGTARQRCLQAQTVMPPQLAGIPHAILMAAKGLLDVCVGLKSKVHTCWNLACTPGSRPPEPELLDLALLPDLDTLLLLCASGLAAGGCWGCAVCCWPGGRCSESCRTVCRQQQMILVSMPLRVVLHLLKAAADSTRLSAAQSCTASSADDSRQCRALGAQIATHEPQASAGYVRLYSMP